MIAYLPIIIKGRMEGDGSLAERPSFYPQQKKRRVASDDEVNERKLPASVGTAHFAHSVGSPHRYPYELQDKKRLPTAYEPKMETSFRVAGMPLADGRASWLLSSEEVLASRQANKRLLQQRIDVTDARLASEQLTSTHPRHASAPYFGQPESSLERLAASSLEGGYHDPSRMMTMVPSLNLMEQRNEFLRQHLLAEHMAAAGLSSSLYGISGHGQALDAAATLYSQSQARGLAGLLSDTSVFPRSQIGLPLPSLNDLSASDRARILGLDQQLRSQAMSHQAPYPGLMTTSTSLSSYSNAGSLSHCEFVLGSRQFLPPLGMHDRSLGSASAFSVAAMEADEVTWAAAERLGRMSNINFASMNAQPFQPELPSSGTLTMSRRSSIPPSTAPLAERLPMPKQGDNNFRTPHFLERNCIPLASEEDQNWLSEMLCFVRADILEVFRASDEDIRSRNSSKGIRLGQVGIRCRYCAHLPKGSRAGRSASFPSSLDRIYQSLTMMLRDHFAKCTSIPRDIQDKFIRLKRKTTQGATDSKLFWVHSAKKMGLMDLEEGGIWVREEDKPPVSTEGTEDDADNGNDNDDHTEVPIAEGQTTDGSAKSNRESSEGAASSAQRRPSDASSESATSSSSQSSDDDSDDASDGSKKRSADELVASSLPVAAKPARQEARKPGTPIVSQEDRESASPYLFTVLSNVSIVYLEDDERVGNRKSLPIGLPGLSCRHCDLSGRKGLCRVFPNRRRNLPLKVQDLCDHLIKCNLCPPSTQVELEKLRRMEDDGQRKLTREERSFYADLWSRMGNDAGRAALY
jgi:hypothetical protein